MTTELPPIAAPAVEDRTGLRKRLDDAFTPDTPDSARLRIIDAIVQALDEPDDD